MMENVLLRLIGVPVAIEVAGRSRKAARAVSDQTGMASVRVGATLCFQRLENLVEVIAGRHLQRRELLV